MTAGPAREGGILQIRGCVFPAHLAYDVENHLWYAMRDDAVVRVGMTAVAPALAGNRIFAFTPKRIGREVVAGRSCATIESSKWVGPARIAVDGTVAAVNEELIANPHLLVEDPYGGGWMIDLRPAQPQALDRLVTGPAIEPSYLAWMNANRFAGCAPPTDGR